MARIMNWPDGRLPITGGKPPSAAAVHASTMRYIKTDFEINGHKYEPEDNQRIARMLAEDSQGKQ